MAKRIAQVVTPLLMLVSASQVAPVTTQVKTASIYVNPTSRPTITTTTSTSSTTTSTSTTSTTGLPPATAPPEPPHTHAPRRQRIRQPAASTDQPSGPSGDVWWALAKCESGNTNANTGNGYYGYFQFSARTWRGVGGPGLPHHHSYEVQRDFAIKLQARSGWRQWPACSRRLGLR